MKAKELMIGDWVNINESNPLYARVSYVNNWKVGLEGITDRDAEDIYPIPLTEEILIENGICYQFGQPWFQGYKPLTTKGVFEIVYKNIVRLPVRYVHELQHAMRLCGLNLIADNFKVE